LTIDEIGSARSFTGQSFTIIRMYFAYHRLCVLNLPSAPWARAFTSVASARSKFQASAWRQPPSPNSNQIKNPSNN